MKKHEKKFLARLEDVNMILKEKTKEYDCGGKTVEITGTSTRRTTSDSLYR